MVSSPFGSMANEGYNNCNIFLKKVSDNSTVFKITPYVESSRLRTGAIIESPLDGYLGYEGVEYPASVADGVLSMNTIIWSLRQVSGVLYLYRNTSLAGTYLQTVSEPTYISISARYADIDDIKYIETN